MDLKSRTLFTSVEIHKVYRDDILDLLLDEKMKKKAPVLSIKKDARGTVFVENIHMTEVECAEQLQTELQRGEEKRFKLNKKLKKKLKKKKKKQFCRRNCRGERRNGFFHFIFSFPSVY